MASNNLNYLIPEKSTECENHNIKSSTRHKYEQQQHLVSILFICHILTAKWWTVP